MRIFLILIFVFSFNFLLAQSNEDSLIFLPNEHSCFDENIQLTNHLMRINEPELAIYQLKKMELDCENLLLCDSVNYILAKTYFSIQDFENSLHYFQKTTADKNSWRESRYYSSLSLNYLNRSDEAFTLLENYNENDINFKQLHYLNCAGTSLLQYKLSEAKTYIELFSNDWYPVAEQQENIMMIYDEMSKFKKKSPFIAASLSTLVPGLGKVYAGRMGEGISAFLINAGLGLVTYENFRKDGFLDAKTIFFGALFTTFYVGNIWGSALSVKLIKDEFIDESNEQILFNLRVPLRLIYE